GVGRMSDGIERTSRLILFVSTLIALGGVPATAARSGAGADAAIEGVRVAALDQPRVYLSIGRTARDLLLESKDGSRSMVEAFLDPGASAGVRSSATAGQFGVKEVKARGGVAVPFEDIGIGGSERFSVSEPLFATLAPYPSNDDPADFDRPIGPVRMQVRS